MKKSMVVSGMNFGTEFISNLYKAVIKRGGTEEQMFDAMKTNSGLTETVADLIVGIKKLALKYLALVQRGISIATEMFPKRSFFSDGPKLYFWNNFKNWVLSEIPEIIPAYTGTLSKYTLTKGMDDAEIQGELGNQKAFTVPEFAAIIKDLIGKQPKGEKNGILLNNGYANIFYVKLANKTVVAVNVRWLGGDREWHFRANALDRVRWDDGDCVFSGS
ncbi:MAG: hypothetical protein QMD50_01605 [Patescibacteria group bacterium]|nr:hypothetical protein [Patescibacteria group bacterium]